MTSTSPAPARRRTGKADAVVCAGKPAQSRGIIKVSRMQGLDTAAELFGGPKLFGDVIDRAERTIRAKIAAERGISDDDIRLTISALEDRSKRMLAHAEKLRGEIAA